MYEDFYQLSADPFRLSPDAGFSFEHRTYRKAMIYMLHALRRAEGFIMVTGRPGTGKTTLVNDLVSTLKSGEIAVARIVSTQLTANDLLDLVANSFNLDFEGCSKANILIRLEVFLKREHLRGRRALLIIDEAQCMGQEVLEEVRLLTNIMVGNQQLLQVFLVGQEQLRETVNTPVLEQLHQRLIAATHLEPLDTDDTRAYIKHRLHCVNWTGDPLISTEAYDWIQRCSQGIPRQINQICSRLFLHGCVEEKHRLGIEDLKTVIGELQQEMLLPKGGEDILEMNSWPVGLLDETYEEELQASTPAPQPAQVTTETPAGAARGSQAQPVKVADTERNMPAGEAAPEVDARPPVGNELADARHGERQLQTHVPVIARQSREGAGNAGRFVMWGGLIIVLVLAVSILALLVTGRGFDQSAIYHEVSTINLPGVQQPASRVSESATDQPRMETPVIEGRADDVIRTTASENDVTMSVPGIVSNEITIQEKPDQVETAAQVPLLVESSPPGQIAENETPVSVDLITGVSPSSEAERITELLRYGVSSMEDDRLLIPEDNSASFYFRQVLKLDPGNSEALNGMGEIVARYTVLATGAFNRGDVAAVEKYIVRGLSVRPYYVDLLVLRDRLNASLFHLPVVQTVPVVTAAGQESVNNSNRLENLSRRRQARIIGF